MGATDRRRPKIITRRACFGLVLLLLGGAIITVAVVWGCVQLERPRVHHMGRENLGYTYPPFADPLVGLPLRAVQFQGSLDLAAFYPIWPGFAVNTVFYAAILWLVFVAPFAWRRRRRIRRGLCPMCAYDLRGRSPDMTVCPECGAAVRPIMPRGA